MSTGLRAARGPPPRSPTLHSRGQSALRQPFVHQSVTGARFTARAVEVTTVGELPADTGTSFLIADSTLFVDRADVLAEGFRLPSHP